jgi:hypothetical protein
MLLRGIDPSAAKALEDGNPLFPCLRAPHSANISRRQPSHAQPAQEAVKINLCRKEFVRRLRDFSPSFLKDPPMSSSSSETRDASEERGKTLRSLQGRVER